MSKKVVLVGHCGADSTYLRIAVNGAARDVSVVTAQDDASLRQLLADGVDLVLLNRTLDYGFSTEEGAELVAQLRASNPEVKTMLVSNYPDAQQLAVRNGALPGFGKRELGSPRVKQLIADALASSAGVASK
jgi:predicted oxidoreductase